MPHATSFFPQSLQATSDLLNRTPHTVEQLPWQLGLVAEWPLAPGLTQN